MGLALFATAAFNFCIARESAPRQGMGIRFPRGSGCMEAFVLNGPSGTWTTLWKEQVRRPTDCLNGIRVVSMLLIVLGHSYYFPMHTAGYRNPEDILNAQHSPWILLLGTGQSAVDTFLFIS